MATESINGALGPDRHFGTELPSSIAELGTVLDCGEIGREDREDVVAVPTVAERRAQIERIDERVGGRNGEPRNDRAAGRVDRQAVEELTDVPTEVGGRAVSATASLINSRARR
jgi:hypothetical protein